MSKEKRAWHYLGRKFKSYPVRKRILISVLSLTAVIILGLGFYYFIILARISETEIDLAALKENINNEKICHEDCLIIRKKMEEAVSAGIKKADPKLIKRLENYWSSPQESTEFKKEIINLWRLNDNVQAVPQYFYDYLDEENGNVELQSLIISSFLSSSPDKQWLNYYFSLLASTRDIALKKEALRALSNRKDKTESFTMKQLDLLENLLLNEAAPLEIRADIVLLIGDYYPIFPAETSAALLKIYRKSELDNISRAFAADILNRNSKEDKLALPDISGGEWENYYNY